MASHPESFPVNTLVPIEGTPLEGNDVSRASQRTARRLTFFLARAGAHCPPNDRHGPNRPSQNNHPSRCGPTHLFRDRTSYGKFPPLSLASSSFAAQLDARPKCERLGLTEQAFMAGANAIFTGEKMLTTPCSGWDEDKSMLGRWGLRGLRSFEDNESVEVDQGSLAKEQPAAPQAASA